MSAKSKPITLGVITGVHGIRGEVKIKSFTADPLAIADYGPLDGSNGREFTIASIKPHKQTLLARLEGVVDRNEAETLKGVELSIARDRLPEAEDGEIYHADLIGLQAMDASGQNIGKVVSVQDFGAGELLELSRPGQKSTILVPFNTGTVPEIDTGAGELILIIPEGLLDD